MIVPDNDDSYKWEEIDLARKERLLKKHLHESEREYEEDIENERITDKC